MDRIVVAIALGSNLPPREQHLAYARRQLVELLADVRFSSIVETEPVGVSVAQGRFLNQMAVGETRLPAKALLERLLEIEKGAGRTRPFERAPRTLDLDLILYGDLIIEEAQLTVPHPRFRDRAFVLDPLAEISPSMVDPVSGKDIATLQRDLTQRG